MVRRRHGLGILGFARAASCYGATQFAARFEGVWAALATEGFFCG